MLSVLTSTPHKLTRYGHKLVHTLQFYQVNIEGINLATAAANMEQVRALQGGRTLEADWVLLLGERLQAWSGVSTAQQEWS